MKLSDDYGAGGKFPFGYMVLIGILAVLTVVGAVFLSNRGSEAGRRAKAQLMAALGRQPQEEVMEEGEDPYISGSTLTSNDLDFWHMYDEVERETPMAALDAQEEDPEEEEDPSTDGLHTRLVNEDGTEEWVPINPYLTKNDFASEGFVYQYPIMKYYADGKNTSKVGIWISSDDGDVDFERLKREGIDFAMIRMGYRGYGSGNLMSDEKFYENVAACEEAGMKWGPTFFSQAVTETEAVEEATRVYEGLQGYTPGYPVVYDMEYVSNDTTRVQSLNRTQKTDIALMFLRTMENVGYKTMLYGNKEWLIRKLDLSKLIGFDVWLSQQEDVPDYPYKFTMWEYTKNAELDGIDRPASLSICFIDYSAK